MSRPDIAAIVTAFKGMVTNSQTVRNIVGTRIYDGLPTGHIDFPILMIWPEDDDTEEYVDQGAPSLAVVHLPLEGAAEEIATLRSLESALWALLDRKSLLVGLHQVPPTGCRQTTIQMSGGSSGSGMPRFPNVLRRVWTVRIEAMPG